MSPRYIGPYEVLIQVGELAYELALLPNLLAVHPLLHISMLKKYVHDGLHKLQHEELNVQPNLTYEEAMQILN